MKNKLFLLASFFLPLFFFVPFANAQSDKIPVSVFVRQGCEHCHEEQAFLRDLQKRRDDFEVIYYDLENPGYYNLFREVTKMEGLSRVTPITLVGNQIISGFESAETTGRNIIDLIDQSDGRTTYNMIEFFDNGGSVGAVLDKNSACDEDGCGLETGFLVKVPFLGVIDIKEYSLPVIAVVLGFIDGFNPCAMWVLVTFLLILLQVGNRKKMWQIAGIFIVAETVMYYLILNVWFSAWDFIGLDKIVTPIVGLVAIGGGIFFLYEGVKYKGICKVTNVEQKKNISCRIQDIANKPFTIVSALAVIGLALSVNVIEFACSIGIPQAFTKVIELNQLSFVKTQMMMALYILFYMIDDLLIFGLAIWGSQKLYLTTKYSKFSNLVGGVLMLILGFVLIFFPSVLRF